MHQLFHSYQWASSFSEQIRGGLLTLTSEDGYAASVCCWGGAVCAFCMRAAPLARSVEGEHCAGHRVHWEI